MFFVRECGRLFLWRMSTRQDDNDSRLKMLNGIWDDSIGKRRGREIEVVLGKE